ncbi:PREDICTED: histone deacetylase 11 isoform X3 [Cercocebus atys]|uniref:histone deacetylase 11 isoform X3 n=1 Tax=Cercocebus atys TaxID=9531 RepID=UPI0005F3A3EB|nr:PREDICTED: histone deacetylase 11 isoform X3 [Cercocebus atys]
MLHTTQLYQHVPETRWPIVYSPRYNITFMGLEKLHPFDAGKWGKVINFLKEEKLLSDSMLVEAREASEEDLLVVHTRRYLNELKWSFAVATITEIPPVIFLPNFLVQRKVLRPLRTQTGGTIMAGKLAVERGWAINVGGGFHHCSSDRGGGFCAYADITLAIKFLFERVEGISRATIIDLDAHQRPSGGRWSWSGAQRMMNTWIRWRGTSRSPSRSTCPTWWCTMQAPTSSRGTDLGGCPSAQRYVLTRGTVGGSALWTQRQQERWSASCQGGDGLKQQQFGAGLALQQDFLTPWGSGLPESPSSSPNRAL